MARARQTLRNYWSGLLIAAAVSYGQLHDDGYTDVRAAQQHPYVWIAPEEWHPRFHPGEMIGQSVITLPLERVTTPSLN